MNRNLLIGLEIALLVLWFLIRFKRSGKPIPWLYILFFLSGFPALIYQLVWQRSLFAIYGINIESVTMIVTAFMLGLGLGSLLGGWLSKIRRPRLLVFGIVELGTAAFGLISLSLFHRVALYSAGTSPLKVGLLTFLLVLIPTMLMGSTLPLLVAHTVERSGNVGHSVGILYFVNTLGSATACFMAGLILMRSLGQAGSVRTAAALNTCVGLSGLVLWKKSRKTSSVDTGYTPVYKERVLRFNGGDQYFPFPIAMAVAALAGSIALGYEILWYRTLSFVTGGIARELALLLGSYLAGIALGSFASKRLCQLQERMVLRRFVLVTATAAIMANILGYLVIPFIAYEATRVNVQLPLLLISVTAACLGASFPLIAHISVAPNPDSGAKLSYLYLSNIVGSASGSFLIGFILMDFWPLQRIAVFLAAMGIGLGISLLAYWQTGIKRMTAMAVCVLTAAMIVVSSGHLFAHIYERLQYKYGWRNISSFAHVVETKSGVITVSPEGTVFGGGVYDGMFNTDLVNDTNWVVRAYALSAFHPAPRQVLMVGLSSGSWAQVIANHPQVEKLTIVEINPGYLRLIPEYPQVASLLRNPKVEIVIDDGRRWLLRNPDKKFDVIVMNTTFHWRDHATNLLSVEFLQMIRQHFNPGGVHFYNTTFSPEAMLTGTMVFPYSLRIVNFLAVSDWPIEVNKQRWREVLSQYRIDGKPVLDLTREKDRKRLEEVLAMADTIALPPKGLDGMELGASVKQRYHGHRIITDDNMGTEWY